MRGFLSRCCSTRLVRFLLSAQIVIVPLQICSEASLDSCEKTHNCLGIGVIFRALPPDLYRSHCILRTRQPRNPSVVGRRSSKEANIDSSKRPIRRLCSRSAALGTRQTRARRLRYQSWRVIALSRRLPGNLYCLP